MYEGSGEPLLGCLNTAAVKTEGTALHKTEHHSRIGFSNEGQFFFSDTGYSASFVCVLFPPKPPSQERANSSGYKAIITCTGSQYGRRLLPNSAAHRFPTLSILLARKKYGIDTVMMKMRVFSGESEREKHRFR